MHMACLVAHRFSIVTVIDSVRPMLEDMVSVAGMSARCASIRATCLSVLEIEQDYDHAERVLIEESRRAVEQDGAEAIVLGCAGMGPLDKRLGKQLGVPVLDGCGCAVTLAESLHRYGITTSKVGAFAMDAARLPRLGFPVPQQ
jgi:allantoin racemase